MSSSPKLALVTGATGYIGGLLVPRLLDAGWRVRVLTRSAEGVRGHGWADDVDVVEGSADDTGVLHAALDGVTCAYYLIHSMDGQGDFTERDRHLAEDFGAAARECAVQRIVYLGGLHPRAEELSEHMASREEVGEALMASGVPTAELRAAVVLGDGSVSFDMLRFLTTRLPLAVAPKWLDNRIQPIAVDDALHYLVAAADLPPEVNRTFDIGGPDVLTYAGMMKRFAAVTGLAPRHIATLPVLTPRLAGYWVGLVTPVDAGVARPLVESLVHEAVCREQDLAELVGPPPGGPTGYDDAVRAAMATTTPDTGLRNLAAVSAAVLGCAVAGSLASDPTSRWYRSLDKPSWIPPGWAFPVAWTLLYADLAASGAAALTTADREGTPQDVSRLRTALGTNLVLNAAWSALFFRSRRPGLATVEAAALAASSAHLRGLVARQAPGWGRALAPYPAWCTFATALSAEVWRRNR